MKPAFITKAVLLVLFYSGPTFADSWPLPQPTKIFSRNKHYYIEVIPRKLESPLKFFDDKVKGIEPAGSPKGLKDNYCKGVFYKKAQNGQYEKVWEQQLSNEVSPVNVLVSDRGEYVVTFDNWHSIGYGDNVVAIYGAGGKLIKKMALSDFMSSEMIMKLPRSVSSVYWGGEHRIDEGKQQLILKVVSSVTESIEDTPKYRELFVDLRNGNILNSSPPRIAKARSPGSLE